MPSNEPKKQVNRCRGIVYSTSERMLSLSQSKPKNNNNENRKESARPKVSPPFNFRNLNSPTSSSTSSHKLQRNSPRQQSSLKVMPPASSPLEKPLPSLPCATIVTKSPFKARRSLIDAEEKPLCGSVSPKFQIYEDWPALSPKKQRLARPAEVPTPLNKPSVSESLIQRIKHLNLEDQVQLKSGESFEPEPVMNNAVSMNPKVKIELLSNQNKQPAPSPTSHSDTKEVGKAERILQKPSLAVTRPSLGTIATSSEKKPQVQRPEATERPRSLSAESNINSSDVESTSSQGSELAGAGSTVTGRARPVKRVDTIQRNRAAAVRARSRSRHRVTSGGSPYAMKSLPKIKSSTNPVRNNSLRLESLKIDLDFTGNASDNYLSEISTKQITQHDPNNKRKSSIPLPSRHIRNSPYRHSKIEVSSSKANKVSKLPNTLIAEEDGNASDTDFEINQNSPSVLESSPLLVVGYAQASRLVTPSHSGCDHGLMPEGSTQNAPVQDSHNEDLEGEADDVLITLNHATDSSAEEFQVKHLSHTSPRQGPILRISSPANRFILGHDSPLAKVSARELKTGNGVADSDSNLVSETCNAQNHNSQVAIESQQSRIAREEVKPPDPTNPKTYFQPDEIEVPFQQAGSKLVHTSDKQDLRNGTVNDDAVGTPTVKSGMPEIDLDNGHMSFREPVVEPFNTNPSPVPDDTLKSNGTDNPEAFGADQGQTAAASTRVAVEERPHKLVIDKSLDKTKTLRSPPTKTGSDIHSSVTHVVPRETGLPHHSSLKSVSQRSTGYRSPSTNAANVAGFKQPPIVETPPQRNMKSYARSKQALNFATNDDAAGGQVSSPVATPGTVSAGKGVIKNIKGLFHKRTAQSLSINGSIHHQADIKKDPSIQKHKAPSETTDPSSSTRLPRSPRVKGTSAFFLPGIADLEPSTFRKHTDVWSAKTKQDTQRLSSSRANESTVKKSGTEAHQVHLTSSPIQADIIPQIEPFKVRSVEIESATILVHRLLDKAKGETRTHRKAELIELSKCLVQILSLARDTERAFEEAKQATARCEKATLMIRKEVGLINERVGRIVHEGAPERLVSNNIEN